MSAPRVLLTRPPHQASPAADALRAAGLVPILIPTIGIAPPTTFAPVDAAHSALSRFDWLLFTSANAVSAFERRCPRTWPSGPLPCKVAAIGSATAGALERIGITPDLIPPQAVAESFAQALLPYAASGSRFLLVRAEQARDHLPETLRAAGGEVTIAAAYRTVIPAGSVKQLRQLFHTPQTWPDAIAFTSSSTVTNLLALLESTGLALPQQIRRISIGPITSQTLRDAGYPACAEADEPTTAALTAAIIQSLIPHP